MSATDRPTATTAVEALGELLDVPAAADYLGVNQTFIRRIIHERRVRYYKVGKYVRLRPTDLDDFVAAGAVEPLSVGGATSPGRRR